MSSMEAQVLELTVQETLQHSPKSVEVSGAIFGKIFSIDSIL